MLCRQELRTRLARFPQADLGHYPTPLEHCPRLSRALGGPTIYIKREDCSGLDVGGNKTRQLRYLLPRALAAGADVLLAGSATQSNWCRQTSAAAARLGLDAFLLLAHGVKGPVLQGNLLLDHILGAEVEIIEIDDLDAALDAELEIRAERMRAAGRRPFVLDGGDNGSYAAVAFVDAMAELDEQLETEGIIADRLYVCGEVTPTGCHVGMVALGRSTRVVGVSENLPRPGRAEAIAELANQVAGMLDLDRTFCTGDFDDETGYVGTAYGVPTPAGLEAIKLVARTEGILLDPVYSSKAMACLIDHIRTGQIDADETVVFIHTGGVPALFAYATEVADAL